MRLIGLGYKKRCGKDTAGAYLVHKHGYARRSFAEPVKDLARMILLAKKYNVNQEAVELVIHSLALGWDIPHPSVAAANLMIGLQQDPSILTDLEGDKPRRLYQYIGTDWGRAHSSNIWVNAMRKQVSRAGCDYVITDVRFPNELHLIHQLGGIAICIERDTGMEDGHASENSVSADDFDIVIENNGTLAELYANLERAINGTR